MSATFQSTVYLYSGSGIPGEQYDDSPWRALPYTINSASAAYNIIGATFCTIDAGASLTGSGTCKAGSSGSYGVAGLLVAPKDYALYGTSGQALDPTLTVSNQTMVQCATMGRFYVTLPAAANVGDYVIFDNTTGAIATVTPGTALPSGKSWANAVVAVFSIGAAGTAVIELDPGFTQTLA